MISWFIARKLDTFEAHYDYDATYMRELLGLGLSVLSPFHKATALGNFRRGVSAAAWHAAKMVTLQAEDCGPCLQLVVQMAAEDGVPAEVISDVLHRRLHRLPTEVALAVRFVDAVRARAPEADAIRAELLPLIGRPSIVSLAYAILSARLYPDLKFALGHGQTCSRVSLEGEVLWTPTGQAHESREVAG